MAVVKFFAPDTDAFVSSVERHIDDDIFMVTYGDGVSDLNIGELVNFHRRHGRLATVTTVRPVSRPQPAESPGL